jgi:hypothetical protein
MPRLALALALIAAAGPQSPSPRAMFNAGDIRNCGIYYWLQDGKGARQTVAGARAKGAWRDDPCACACDGASLFQRPDLPRPPDDEIQGRQGPFFLDCGERDGACRGGTAQDLRWFA